MQPMTGLKTLRAEARLSAEKLARAMPSHPIAITIYNLETGRRGTSIEKAQEIADVLAEKLGRSVTLDDLFRAPNNKKRPAVRKVSGGQDPNKEQTPSRGLMGVGLVPPPSP